MNNFLSKIMYFIIAVLVSVCVFMALCEMNPSLSEPIKGAVAEFSARVASTEEETVADESAVEEVEATAAVSE